MKHIFIIAEAGVNHDGSLELALKLVDAAAEAGVDAVKFQTFKADALVTKTAEKAEYQKVNTGSDESQYQMLKRLELSEADHAALKKRCDEKGVLFLSTAFDIGSVKYLDSFGVPVMKVPSGDITNLPYLRAVNECGKSVLLSTGMATLDEIEAAIHVFTKCNVTLLHCTTAYPCPFDAVNLRAMKTIKERFNVPVGYSDHTPGIAIPIAAAAMGAEVIEKHFTLDRTMKGPDHKASVEPSELKDMVTAIRNVEIALGDGDKRPVDSELKNKPIARKSIVAACHIGKGESFTEKNLTTMRPENGISPMRWDDLIGKMAMREYQLNEMIDAVEL